MSATGTEAFVVLVGATAETIRSTWSWHDRGDDEREALGHLAVMATALRTDDDVQAKASMDAIDDVLRRVRARQTADQQAENAALLEAGWTPPEAE